MRLKKPEPNYLKLNWNSKVKVKLTDYGKDIYFHQYDHLIERGASITPTYPIEDNDGFTSFQLWVFMNLYGPYISMTSKPVVEDISFYIPEDELEHMEVVNDK